MFAFTVKSLICRFIMHKTSNEIFYKSGLSGQGYPTVDIR